MTMVKFFTASLVSVLVLESSAHAVCGNGVLDSGEACEDGNTTNGDGCDNTCAIESGWDCTEAVFELDFYENYTQDGHPAPNWTLSPNGRTVSQSENFKPSVYVSTYCNRCGSDLHTSSNQPDDDFIGWAVGYEQETSTIQFRGSCLIETRRSSQWWLYSYANGGGRAGLAMSRVTGASSPDYWCHTGL